MNERVKELRKDLGITMEKFGERLGVTKTAISRLEKGERSITDQMFKAICREFNVSEDWLRAGEGHMYKTFDEDKLTAYVADIVISDDDFIKDFIEVYMELDAPCKQALRTLANNMAQKIKEKEQS